MGTAVDFYKKYGLVAENSRIDKDLVTTCVQNDSVDMGELKKDFSELPAKDRYEVLARLKKGGDKEVIRTFLGLKYFNDNPLKNGDEAAREWMHFLHTSLQSDADIWEKRIAVFTTTFALKGLTDALAADASNPYTIERLFAAKIYIFAGLEFYYKNYGNEFWDTDDDQVFDDADPQPLLDIESDTDGDGVPKIYDPNDANASQWSNIPVGETRQNITYSVTRTAENAFQINIQIGLQIDEKALNRDELFKLLDPKYLDSLKKGVEKAFDLAAHKWPYNFKLNVEFVPHRTFNNSVTLTDRGVRANAYLWNVSHLDNKNTLLHEIFHIIGEPDYYYEPIVRDGTRDSTFQPGKAVIGEEHLMSCAPAPTIPQRDLIRIAANANDPELKKADNSDSPDADKLSPFDELYMEAKYTSAEELTKLIASEKDQFKRDVYTMALARDASPEVSTATIQALTDIYERNKDNLEMCEAIRFELTSLGANAEALDVALHLMKERYMWPYSATTCAELQKKSGDIAGAERTLKVALAASASKEDESTILYELLRILARQGKDWEIERLIAESGNDNKKLLAEAAAAGLIEAGKSNAAKSVYWKFHDEGDIDDNLDYVALLRNLKLKAQSHGWFYSHTLPLLNPDSGKDMSILESEIARLRNENALVPPEYYEMLTRAYPANIDHQLGYAVTLFKTGRIEEARERMRSLIEAYSFNLERGLLPNFSQDDFMKQVGDAFEKAGIVKEVLKEYCLNGTSQPLKKDLIAYLKQRFEKAKTASN